MADVASLGLAVNSSGVSQGTVALNNLSTAANKAAAAATGVSSATQNAGQAAVSLAASAGQAAAQLNQQGAAATKATAALNANYVAANNNSTAAKNTGYQMRLVAMQLSQVAQQTQASGNFIQALAIQLPDLALGFGAFGIALGVVAGILLPLIHAGHLAAAALNLIADNLQPIAPYAVAAAAGLALLYAPAILGGLTFLSEAILGVTARLFGLAAGFALANPAGIFVLGLTIAAAAVIAFRDEITKALGFDLVGVVNDSVNYIVGTFVGGYEGIKKTWAMLPNAIGDLVYSAADFTAKGIEAMINAAIDKINAFVGMAYNSMSGLAKKLGVDLGTFTGIQHVDLGGVQNPYAGKAGDAASAIGTSITDAQGKNYTGDAINLIGKYATATTEKVKELATWLAKIDDPKAKKSKHHGKTDAEKFDDIVVDANTKLATLKAEQASVGMSEIATAKLRYETEFLNAAQQKGITLTDAQRDKLMGLADQMAETAVATKKAKEALDFAKDATRGFLDDLQQGLENGKGFWQSFGDAALNVLDKIISKIEDELIESLFTLDSGGSGGGLGGILDFALNGFKGFASGGYTGGAAANKVAGIVHGGEYVFSKRATDSIGVGTLDRLHGFARSGGAGSSGAPAANTNQAPAANQNMHVTIGWSQTADGNLRPFIESVSQGTATQAVAAYDRQMPGRVKQINADPRKR